MLAVHPTRRVLAGLLGVCILALHAMRIDSGVDLADESVYVAIPYRFVLGDRPFVDEINPIQSAALVSMPVVRCLVWILGGTEGLVLATRSAAFAFECLVALLVVVLLRPRFGGAMAGLIALVAVVLAPQIATLTYTSLLSTFLTLGLVLAAIACERDRPALLPAAGAALGLACIAFPPAVLGFGACAFAVVSHSHAGRWRRALLLGLGALAVALLMAPAVLDLGRETLDYVRDHLSTRGSWSRRASRIPVHAWSVTPAAFLAAAGALALLFALRGRWMCMGAALAGFLPLLASVDLGYKSGSWSTVLVAAAAPLFVIPLWREGWVRALFVFLWIPAAITGVAQAYTGSVGVLFTGFAMVPAAIVTLAAGALAADRAARGAPAILRVGLPLVASCTFASVLLVAKGLVQNEAPLEFRTECIASGPYRGLWTTPRKRALVESLGADLRALDDGHRRLLCYFLLPGGYLMTSMRPASNNAWGLYCYPARTQPECLEPYVENLARFGRDGVVILKLKRGVDLEGESPTGPADDWIRAHYRLVLERAEYDVFVAP